MKTREFFSITAISILFLFATFSVISCAPAVTETPKIEEEEQEITKEEIEELEEAIEEAIEEEVIEEVDYENAQISANLSGYMPSYLCTDADNYVKIVCGSLVKLAEVFAQSGSMHPFWGLR